MDDIVRAGKVRFVGVSNFTVEQMEACMRVRRVDVVQVGYHLFDRRMEQEVFPYCARHGIGVMGYGPLGHGLLTGTFTATTRFADPDWRAKGIAFGQPIFTPENLPRNVAIVDRLRREVAEPLGVPVSQLALAWVLRNPVVSTALVGRAQPGRGGRQPARAPSSTLSDADVARIDEIMAEARRGRSARSRRSARRWSSGSRARDLRRRARRLRRKIRQLGASFSDGRDLTRGVERRGAGRSARIGYYRSMDARESRAESPARSLAPEREA